MHYESKITNAEAEQIEILKYYLEYSEIFESDFITKIIKENDY